MGKGRLAVLAAATMLAPIVLFVQGERHAGDLDWLAVGIGAVVLFPLVLTRMAGFITQVQRRAANSRTW